MDFINLLGSAWPSGGWSTVISWFDVGNYAWTIILFTVVLKLLLSPLDFLQRFFTNKTTRAQARIQPELEKLKKRYGQNQNLLYQKQNELYQKNNVSMKGSCIVMLLYMGATLAIFITLWQGLQGVANFKIKNQYEQLETTYSNSYEVEYIRDYLEIDILDEGYLQATPVQKELLITEKENLKANEEEVLLKKQTAIENAQSLVVSKYGEIKDSWLWIKNIWRADKATVSEILTYDSYISATGISGNDNFKTEYNLVMAKLLDGSEYKNGVNGYYLLSVIVVIVSFLAQFLTKKMSQPKGTSPAAQPKMTKILMFALPIIMLVFTLNNSAAFAIYIIMNSVMSAIITPFTTIISNKIEDKNEVKRKESIKVDYRR